MVRAEVSDPLSSPQLPDLSNCAPTFRHRHAGEIHVPGFRDLQKAADFFHSSETRPKGVPDTNSMQVFGSGTDISFFTLPCISLLNVCPDA